MTSNSLTEDEEQDIPYTFEDHIWIACLGYFFTPKYVWFPVHLKGPVIRDPNGQLAELIVYITSTRVDLYSHQILLCNPQTAMPEFVPHCSDKIMRARWRLKSPASPLFAQLLAQAQIKENIKAPRYWPLWGEFTGHRWIPRTRGQ